MFLRSLSLSIIIGKFSRCKKYPSMELRGLFQYLVNQLKKGNGIELVFMQVWILLLSFVTCDLVFLAENSPLLEFC